MTTNERHSVLRRDVLKTIGLGAAVGVVGFSVAGGRVRAATTETLYLIENDEPNDPVLFSVDLIDGTPNRAELTQLATFPASELAAPHIAATPDGEFVYLVDRETGNLGRYDVVNDSYDGVVGPIADHPGGVVLASFSPSGELWMASRDTDTLYTVSDYDTAPTAVEVGDTGIDLAGADIAFTADGTLYVYTNATSSLYTADTTTGAATLVGSTGANFTGLAVRNAGLGDLVGSTTSEDDIVVFDRDTGAIDARYPMYLGDSEQQYPYVFGDMTVGELVVCEAEYPLCAGQDIDVGTVTVTSNGTTLDITYEIAAPWLLYETHAHVADSESDIPQNRKGNPKIGQFEYSMTHDGVSSYTIEDVPFDGEVYIATHAVVRPEDGCVDFGEFLGESVEGMGTVAPLLDIQSSYADGAVVGASDESGPKFYGSDDEVGFAGGATNGCLDPAGFADESSTGASGNYGTGGRAHEYVFSVADGYSLNEFSLRMLDFGDFNPGGDGHHYAEMVARDADGNVVAEDVLEYWSDGKTNPVEWYATEQDQTDGIAQPRTLTDAGDACNATEGEPGNYLWSVSGDGIVEIELTFGDGYDPNIAFRDLCFTAQDETAWTCPDADGVESFVERGSWATYFTYAGCDE